MIDETTTLADALQAKIDAAKALVVSAQSQLADAEAVVATLEAEVAPAIQHLGSFTWAEIKAKVESWFN